MIREKYIWHRLEGFHSNTFECDSNKFELVKHFWRVQKCSEFCGDRESDERKKYGQSLGTKLEVENTWNYFARVLWLIPKEWNIYYSSVILGGYVIKRITM